MKCIKCKEDIHLQAPFEEIDGHIYCGDCAFIEGLISEQQYLKKHLFFISLNNLRAAVYEGQIYVSTNKFPWERPSRSRECKEYSKWRKAVYERDNYTCQECGKRGGELNAHHIKPYAKYPKLIYDVDNGITLCEKCHKEYHKTHGRK